MLRMSAGFEIVCEIEPPVSGDLGMVREQIAVLRSTCDAFLVPDSRLGRATVSSVAVAHEVEYLQGRAVPQRTGPQPAWAPARPAHGQRLWRRGAAVRLRGSAAAGRAHRPDGAPDAGGSHQRHRRTVLPHRCHRGRDPRSSGVESTTRTSSSHRSRSMKMPLRHGATAWASTAPCTRVSSRLRARRWQGA